ncbi:SAM-dependent methyltransferase [Agaribacterium sp. ZY112]|uniref:SAM-dependent methyltransferase n=1 Tax=Agaribacterium sp. ZY112 TaxID=3233574 RepID=UPI0035246238
MMQTKNPIKTSTVRALDARLQHLFEWALSAHSNSEQAFHSIWDICCDHGRLGLHLHRATHGQTTNIHLVDCVPSIIDAIHSHYASLIDQRLNVSCQDASKLTLPTHGRHLFILAGIGGGTAIEIVQNIYQQALENNQLSELDLEIILSPNSRIVELREFLRNGHFELLNEAFICVYGRHHEHMHLRFHPNKIHDTENKQLPSIIGDKIWQDYCEDKVNYLEKLLDHHQRRLNLSGNNKVKPIVEAYKSALLLQKNHQ